MNRPGLIVLLCLLGGAALCAAIFFAAFERKEVSTYTPAHGEARYNRFFALELSLKQLHIPVSSVTVLPTAQALHPDDVLVLGEGLSRIEPAEAAYLAAWVDGGGYLILSPGDAELATRTPLFQRLDLLKAEDAGTGCDEVVSGKDDKFQLCGKHFRLDSMDQTDASIGTVQGGYAFVRTAYGGGQVGLLDDLDVLSSEALRHPAQQQFARRLLLPPDRDVSHVYLLYALDGPSFWGKLLSQGWPALLAFSLLLLAWALMRGERLGPLIPAPPQQRRALLEHVQAIGEFLYRRDGGRSLHAIACRIQLARVCRRDPLCAALHDEALYQRIAERYRLDPAQLARAFQPPANALAFRESLAILARLRSRP